MPSGASSAAVADTEGSGPVVTDLAELRGWIGRQEARNDVILGAPLRAMAATLDCPAPGAGPGEHLPEPWHWLFFLPAPAASALDTDGHPRRGDFLPPVPLPRRMWAGSSIRFLDQLHVGDEVQRVSTIADVSLKQGSSGALVFVSVQHAIYREGELVLEEDQQLVYRESGGSGPAPAQPAPAQAQWSRELVPDPVLLFRYSALTFNSHRIHYDRDYAVQQEGYAGLVVQGPLTATLVAGPAASGAARCRLGHVPVPGYQAPAGRRATALAGSPGTVSGQLVGAGRKRRAGHGRQGGTGGCGIVKPATAGSTAEC